MLWAYGITTVPSRRYDLLPRTLESLARAGFDKPHLFVDDCHDPAIYKPFGLDLTTRFPKVRVAGHWTLSIAELYLRNPAATRYAIFQDDVIASSNLRRFLDKSTYPTHGYWNLYTVPCNEELAVDELDGDAGWYPSRQNGKGALALIFDRATLLKLFLSEHFVERPQDAGRGWRAIDGGVVTALNKAGVKEYVHFPSLVQHIGNLSSMRNSAKRKPTSFKGEEYDALTFLSGAGYAQTPQQEAPTLPEQAHSQA